MAELRLSNQAVISLNEAAKVLEWDLLRDAIRAGILKRIPVTYGDRKSAGIWVTRSKVQQLARRGNLLTADEMVADCLTRRRAGETFAAIAASHALSVERIRQLVAKGERRERWQLAKRSQEHAAPRTDL